jgi:acetyl-CoA acetyltransferase
LSIFDDKVAITGLGQSKVARFQERGGFGLTIDSVLAAIADAGLTADDIDGLATFPGADNTDPGYVGAGAGEVIDALGLRVDWFLGACETAGQFGPVMDACMAVALGLANHVVCFRTLTESSAQGRQGRGGMLVGGKNGTGAKQRHYTEWSSPFGAKPPNLMALFAMAYMNKFGVTKEQLGQIALTARANAAKNPNAYLQAPMSMEDYLSARMITTPLSLYDCDIPVDGSTAVIISRSDIAKDLPQPTVLVNSVGCSIHGRNSFDQSDLLHYAVHDSAAKMWERTDLTPADVDVAELYDGFSYMPLIWLEALGICGVGEAGQFVEGGKRIALNGEMPINTQGGQLSGGRLHGLGFLHEAALQLRGQGGDRQVPNRPEVAVASAGAVGFAGCMLLTRGAL